MDAFIEVFTSGDLTKVASFTITFIVVAGVLLSILIVAKKFGITLTYKNKDGTGFHNNATEQKVEKKVDDKEKPITIKDLQELIEKNQILKQVDETTKEGIKKIETDSKTDSFSQKLSEAQKESDEIWDSLLSIKFNKKIEEKDKIILTLEKENDQLKAHIFNLNKELEQYSYLDDPILLDYKNNIHSFKFSYDKVLKKICLNKKISNFKSDNELKQYAKITLQTILIVFGKKIMTKIPETKSIWENETIFANQIKEIGKAEFFNNFLKVLKKIVSISEQNKEFLETEKEKINKKIMAYCYEYLSKHWEKTFDPKKLESVEEIKKIRASCKYYTTESFSFKEIYNLTHSIGIDMISIYEQIKTIVYDQQMLIAQSFFTNIDLLISILLKEYVLNKAKEEKKNERDSLVDNIFND